MPKNKVSLESHNGSGCVRLQDKVVTARRDDEFDRAVASIMNYAIISEGTAWLPGRKAIIAACRWYLTHYTHAMVPDSARRFTVTAKEETA